MPAPTTAAPTARSAETPSLPPRDRVAALLVAHGRTFAAEADLTLRDSPSALLRLLVLAMMLAAPVPAPTAIRASRALRPVTRTAAVLGAADPDELSRLLTGAGYWRFHRTKAGLLVRAGAHLQERYDGDLRRLYREATSSEQLHALLRTIPGVGTHAAHIVLREAQGVWPDLQPYLDERVLDGAARLGLPTTADELAGLVDPADLPRLAAVCVRATLRSAGAAPVSASSDSRASDSAPSDTASPDTASSAGAALDGDAAPDGSTPNATVAPTG